MSNYLTYPFKTMGISQGYSEGNHNPHIQGHPIDYPIDEAGADTGRDWFFCPCNEMKVTKMYGSQSVGRHIWLESTASVDLAKGSRDYITIFAVHLEADDWEKLKVGQTFKRDQAIFREGASGKATGNHIHMCVGLGSAKKSGFWKQNSKSAWVLVTSGGPLKPEDAFFVDTSFTTVKSSRGIVFKALESSAKTNSSQTNSTDTKPVSTPVFAVGKKVKIKKTALKYSRSTVTIPSKYKNIAYTIQQVGNDDFLLKELYSWVKKTDCEGV